MLLFFFSCYCYDEIYMNKCWNTCPVLFSFEQLMNSFVFVMICILAESALSFNTIIILVFTITISKMLKSSSMIENIFTRNKWFKPCIETNDNESCCINIIEISSPISCQYIGYIGGHVTLLLRHWGYSHTTSNFNMADVNIYECD